MNGQLGDMAGGPSAAAGGGYRIERRAASVRRGRAARRWAVLYRFGGPVEAVERWERMMRLIREGVSGRRGELRLVGRDGRVMAGVEVRVVRVGNSEIGARN